VWQYRALMRDDQRRQNSHAIAASAPWLTIRTVLDQDRCGTRKHSETLGSPRLKDLLRDGTVLDYVASCVMTSVILLPKRPGRQSD